MQAWLHESLKRMTRPSWDIALWNNIYNMGQEAGLLLGVKREWLRQSQDCTATVRWGLHVLRDLGPLSLPS